METKVLGGLPVTVEYNWSSGDPSVGINPGVEEWWISHIAGKPCKSPDWIYSRLSEKESDRIMQECDLHSETAHDDDFDIPDED